MMGINIPDMVQIIKEHGLVPVPVDYDLDTMSPISFDEVKNAINEKVIKTYLISIFRQNVCYSHIYLACAMISRTLLFGVKSGALMCLRM